MNRIELFNIVWLLPLSKIEQEKNIKIKDIKVACIKYEIPLPEKLSSSFSSQLQKT
jgi:hypothetical protein